MKQLFVFALAALALSTSVAHAGNIAVGVFGGSGIPIAQDDQDKGTLFGVRAQTKLVPLFALEPFYSSTALGDKTVDLGGFSATREGSKVTSYGLNAMLTMGGPIRFYPYAGIGQAKFTRSGQDESFTSYHLGLGFGLSPMPKFSFDLRGEVQSAVDGAISRKIANVTLGASYSLFSIL